MMEYNNYYPAQTGQPPPTMMNNQHMNSDCTMMGGQMTPNSLMHSSPAPSTPVNMRHTPGLPPMQHQMSSHPITPQPQSSPHPNYHQLPSQPPISLSASPHPSSTPHSMGQPPPRPATGPSPLHHQSPIHMNGQSPKNPPHGPMPIQPSNQLPPGSPGAPMHPQAIIGAPTHHHPPPPPPHGHGHGHSHSHSHGHGYPNGPMPPHGAPHYGQPHLPPPHMNHGPPPPPPPPMQGGTVMSGGPPPGPPLPPSGYMPPHLAHHPGNPERGSPFYQIPPSEFRIIELNKRLQSRPRVRGPNSPLPLHGSSDESMWWERFTCDFFDDDASLTVRTPGEDKPVEYTIGRTLIPRFFRSYFDGGVTDLSIKLRNIRESQPHPSLVTLDCDQADIVTKNIFKHPATNVLMYVVVHTEGHLSLEFVTNSFDTLVIKSWRFYANQCHEYIDRSMTTTGLSNAYLVEPVTRFGLTKSTIAYLKMCMIMEPMQDLMVHHRKTQMDPRACLKHLLFDRYKIKNLDDNRAQPNKRRKRKAPATTGATTNKKAKASAQAANLNGGNVIGMMPPNDVGIPNLPLASQNILLVGEPSMLGADFGDENERRITRLENNQYDSSTDQSGQSQSNLTSDINEMTHNQNLMGGSNVSSQNQSTQLNNNNNNNLPNHMTQGSNLESTGNGIQSMLDYQNNVSNNGNGGINDHGGSNSNEMTSESNLISANNNNDNGNTNCMQSNNNNNSNSSNANETNHQVNSYPMNGETNHIKTEMDPQQPKQSLQPPNQHPNTITESEAR